MRKGSTMTPRARHVRPRAVLAGIALMMAGFSVRSPSLVDADGVAATQKTTVSTGPLGLAGDQIAYLSVSDIGTSGLRSTRLELIFFGPDGSRLKSARVTVDEGKTVETRYGGTRGRIPVRAAVVLTTPEATSATSKPTDLAITYAIVDQYSQRTEASTGCGIKIEIKSRGTGDRPPVEVYGPCAADDPPEDDPPADDPPPCPPQ